MGVDPAVEPTYKWCISAGTITKGEGTSAIEMDTAEVKDDGITVTVMIREFPWPCDNVAIYKITIPENFKSETAPPNNGMHPTRDMNHFINRDRAGGRVMPGVGRLTNLHLS